MSAPVRVRFAPSPTGNLHIGGARTALFNWAYARRNKGQFLLRIEDTDPERSTKEFERAILAGLRWLGLDWDEGPDIGGPHAPYHQALRIGRHRELMSELLAQGKAYRCFCSTERLDKLHAAQIVAKERLAYDGVCRRISKSDSDARAARGESFTIRFAVPAGETRFVDHVRGEVVFDNREVEDWVMVRSDGNPTYNFVVVCDDVDMQITHVFRGEEHLVNTPKQVLLYKALGKAPPQFGHLPLMLGTDRKKLSKRTGDTALQDYQDRGYPKEAVVNFLCLQGWALNGTQEIFSIDDLVLHFDIKDVSKAGAVFDMDKFAWLSGEYIRRDSVEHVAALCAPYLEAQGLATVAELERRKEWWYSIVTAEKERIKNYSELAQRVAYLFASDEQVVYAEDAEKNARKHEQRVATLRAYQDWLAPQIATKVDKAVLHDGTKAWVAAQGLKFPALMQPLRCALTGMAGGPDCFDVMGWLGAQRTLRRIEIAFERLA